MVPPAQRHRALSLKEWDSFKSIAYEANPDFYLGMPSIPYVVYQLYSGVGLRLYESGEIDMTGIGSYNADRVPGSRRAFT